MSETKAVAEDFDKEIGLVASSNLAGRVGPPTPRDIPSRVHSVPERAPGKPTPTSLTECIATLESYIFRAQDICSTIGAHGDLIGGSDSKTYSPNQGPNSGDETSIIGMLLTRLHQLDGVLNEMVHHNGRIERALR